MAVGRLPPIALTRAATAKSRRRMAPVRAARSTHLAHPAAPRLQPAQLRLAPVPARPPLSRASTIRAAGHSHMTQTTMIQVPIGSETSVKSMAMKRSSAMSLTAVRATAIRRHLFIHRARTMGLRPRQIATIHRRQRQPLARQPQHQPPRLYPGSAPDTLANGALIRLTIRSRSFMEAAPRLSISRAVARRRRIRRSLGLLTATTHMGQTGFARTRSARQRHLPNLALRGV